MNLWNHKIDFLLLKLLISQVQVLLDLNSNTCTCNIKSFKTLVSFWSWAGWFEYYPFENPRRQMLVWFVSNIELLSKCSKMHVRYNYVFQCSRNEHAHAIRVFLYHDNLTIIKCYKSRETGSGFIRIHVSWSNSLNESFLYQITEMQKNEEIMYTRESPSCTI